MNCWNCGAPLNLTGKIPFREECGVCHAALHCCRNCVHYKPGLPNDCMVLNTDFITDRTAINFCEEFKILGKSPEKKVNPKDVSKKLFGDEEEKSMNEKDEEGNSKFNNLFK
jgi:hypothetical protein